MEIANLKEQIDEFNSASDKLIHNIETINAFMTSGKSIMLGKKEIAALFGMSEQQAIEFLNSKEVKPKLFRYGKGLRISLFNLLKIRSVGGD